jgi:hypothetical protein
MESTAFLICLTNVLIVANVNCEAVRCIFLFDNVANVNCEAVRRNFFLFDDRSYYYECKIATVCCIGIHRIFDLFDDRSYCYECKIAAVCFASESTAFLIYLMNVKLPSAVF